MLTNLYTVKLSTKLFPVNLPIISIVIRFAFALDKKKKKLINFVGFHFHFTTYKQWKTFSKNSKRKSLNSSPFKCKMKEKNGFEFAQWMRNENQCVSITYSKTVRIPFVCSKWAHHTIPIPPINGSHVYTCVCVCCVYQTDS